jgi:hypothetical protein
VLLFLALPQHIDGINLFGMISIASLIFCIPAAIYAESHMWGAAWNTAVQSMGAMPFYQLLAMSGLFYHLYNQVTQHSAVLEPAAGAMLDCADDMSRVECRGCGGFNMG